MALKKRKWIFLSILIVALIIGITFALAILNPEGGMGSAALTTNTSSNPTNKGGGLGTGTLYVYTDKDRKIEASKNPAEIYLVLYGRTYYFRVSGITEYEVGKTIHVWANYLDSDYIIGDYTVGPDGTINFEWTIPTLPYQTEIKYKYGLNLTGPNPSWRFAKRTTQGVGLTLVIPQVPLGALGVISAFIAAYSIKSFTTKRLSRIK